jgi:Fe-S oxidoreductase
VLLLSEFLDKHCHDTTLPQRGGKALVQIHCHQHAVLDEEAESRVLKRLGVEVELLPGGCCGMAGSFGFEAEKYDISEKIAERALLPRLRRADGEAVLADGFSCREQIEQMGGRQTQHFAEVLASALGATEERRRVPERGRGAPILAAALAVGLVALMMPRAAARER